MSNPHPDRPIAVPKRRFNRASSNTSAGSQGTPPANPLSGFTFNGTSAPLTAAKPPVAAPNFNTGFGNSSLTGFNNTGFSSPATSVPTTPTAANPTTNTGFGGFQGFGNANVTPSPFGSAIPPTTTPVPPVTTTATNPAFGTGFGTPTTNSPFTNFGQPPKVNETPSAFSFGTPVNPPAAVSSSPFGFSIPASTTPMQDNKPIETPSPFAGFGSPAVKPATPTNFSFGNNLGEKKDETTKPFSFNTSASSAATNLASPSVFTFPTAVKTGEEKSNEKPSPFGASSFQPTGGFSFKTPMEAKSTKDETTEDTRSINSNGFQSLTAKSTGEATPTSFSFNNPVNEKEATEKTPLNPSTGFSFGNKKEDGPNTTTTEKKSPFTFGTPVEKPTAATASPFGTPAKSDQDKPFTFNKPKVVPASSDTEKEKPSLFSSFGVAPTKDADKPSPFGTPPKDAGKPSPFTFGQPAKSTDAAEKEKSSPFSFNKPTESTDTGKEKASPFTFNPPAKSNNESEKEKPSPFTFNSPAKSSNESEKEKPSPFTFNSPAKTSNEGEKEKPSPFTFNSPAKTTNETEKDKPSPFTFNSPAKTANETEKEKPSPFSFNLSAKPSNEADKEKPSPFKFGPPVKFTNEAEKDKSSPFSFNSPAKTTNETDKEKPSPFSFATSAKPAENPSKPFGTPMTTEQNKEEGEKTAAKPFTFNFATNETAKPLSSGNTTSKTEGSNKKRQLERDTDEDGPSSSKKLTSFTPTTTSTTPKTTFTFGTPPTDKEKTTATPSPFSFPGTKSTDTTSTETKPSEKPLSFGTTTSSTTAAASTTKEPSKLPTINFGNASSTKEAEKETETKTPATSTGAKKVTFGGSTPVAVETPGSVDLAFSRSSSGEGKTSGPLSLSKVEKDTKTSSERPVQTTLKSTVTEPSQITYKTCFWELPDEARNELALLANFITEQTDTHDKIADEINSSFGPDLINFGIKALTMDNDAQILRKQLEVQGESLHELISKNKDQRLNAVAASNVQKQNTKDWRTRGMEENWAFFQSTIDQMENRLHQFAQTTVSIQDAVNSLQKDTPPTPEAIGNILQEQRRMYLSLAGRIAELHQDADRVIKRRKIN